MVLKLGLDKTLSFSTLKITFRAHQNTLESEMKVVFRGFSLFESFSALERLFEIHNQESNL